MGILTSTSLGSDFQSEATLQAKKLNQSQDELVLQCICCVCTLILKLNLLSSIK